MGVQGLWHLLQPSGKPVSLESLEGKILAVDVSIWLHQAAKGMRDKSGNPLPNAHLQSLFIRVCKLLFYRIKPVFVFDGGVPILKKQTLAARRERKEEAEEESGKATKKLLQNLIRSQAVKAALGKPSDGSSAAAVAAIRSTSKGPDMFELPPLPEVDKESTGALNYDGDDDLWEDKLHYQRIIEEEFQSLEQIDVESDDFNALPGEIKHEILTEMKEVRKRRRLGRVAPMPQDSNDFSAFQMAKLVKQSRLTNHIESVRKEMNAKNTADFSKAIGEDYMAGEFETRRVVSEDASHYILVKGLSKQRQLEQAAKCEDIVEDVDSDAVKKAESKEEKELLEEPDDLMIESDKEETFGEEKSANSRENDCCINIGPDLFVSKADSKSDSSSESDSDVMITESSQARDAALEQKSQIDAEVKSVSESPLEPDVTEIKIDDVSGLESSLKRRGDIIKVSASDEPKVSKMAGDISKTDSIPSESVKESSEVSIDSESDDDEGFIEINVDPISAKEDDLFPAEMFSISNPSEEPRSDQMKSQVDESLRKEILPSTSPSKPTNDIDVKAADLQTAKNNVDDDTTSAEQKPKAYTEFNIGDYQLDEREDEGEVAPPSGGESEVDIEMTESPQEFKGMTVADLEDMQEDLANESETLRAERGRQERLATSITDQMNVEAQELLRLFGIPYVVSPMEAEAQCAQLDILGLTHGTITDDSDIWLFGGNKVYKNFFNQKRTVECFNVSAIQSQFGLDREKLINIAYLCGSDYTEGIQGVGPVTALEILGEFPGHGIEGLVSLKSWWDESQAQGKKPVTSKVKSKIRELEFRDGFPNPAVIESYLHPTIDESSETFSWGTPDLDLLRDYASEKMGWSKQKTDDLILPVLKQLNKKETQAKINSFFQPEYFMESKKIVSKRVKQALNKVRGVYNTELPKQTTNEEKIQKAKEVLGMPKGRGKGRGRGRGRGKVTGQRSAVKVKDEVALSESSSSDEGGFVREEEKIKEKAKGQGDVVTDVVKHGKGKGRGKNRKYDLDFDAKVMK